MVRRSGSRGGVRWIPFSSSHSAHSARSALSSLSAHLCRRAFSSALFQSYCFSAEKGKKPLAGALQTPKRTPPRPRVSRPPRAIPRQIDNTDQQRNKHGRTVQPGNASTITFVIRDNSSREREFGQEFASTTRQHCPYGILM